MIQAAGPAMPLLSVRNLKVYFPAGRARPFEPKAMIKAVDDVSFEIAEGETLALVGESGCGKTTTGSAVLGLVPITSGRVAFDGRDITAMNHEECKKLWRELQVVFQDPVAALNPKRTIGQSITEPLSINRVPAEKRRARLTELLDLVGLNDSLRDRFPNELSGGQRQRVVIARALALQPRLIICDEPVSALDVSIQSQILNLLMRLQNELGLSYLFISHDLSVVRHIADRVVVMYLGTIVEEGPVDALFSDPQHPYTEALLSAILEPDPLRQRARESILLRGELPSPLNAPKGCPFVTRCPLRESACEDARPELVSNGRQRFACLVRARAFDLLIA
ncbi:MAG: ABC transporter ATP-binding protein [Devosia sp.]